MNSILAKPTRTETSAASRCGKTLDQADFDRQRSSLLREGDGDADWLRGGQRRKTAAQSANPPVGTVAPGFHSVVRGAL